MHVLLICLIILEGSTTISDFPIKKGVHDFCFKKKILKEIGHFFFFFNEEIGRF